MRPNYNDPQDELYTGEQMTITNFENNLVEFTDYKPKYNAAYVVSLKAELAAARAIPDLVQRVNDNEGLRVQLMRRLKAEEGSMVVAEGEKNLGKLRSYITTAYTDKLLRKARLSESGLDEYELVMRYNWEKVVTVLESGKEFIVKYETDLLAGDNMPPGFKLVFDTMADSITVDVNAYLIEREQLKVVTQSKIVANNNLHTRNNEIRRDGQEIFKRNPAMKALFVWESIMDIVTPPGAAGLRGSVRVSGSNYAVVGAMIEMQTAEGTPVTFVTDADGNYYSGHLPVGVYSFKLTKEGFATIETEVEIKLGTTSYKHWLMSAGTGTVVVLEGGLAMNEIANQPIPGGVNDDTFVTLEGLAAQMKYYAGDSADGEQTGSGALYANIGVPITMKWSQIIAQIGLDGVHSFFNVKNVGAMSGAWRVTFVIP